MTKVLGKYSSYFSLFAPSAKQDRNIAEGQQENTNRYAKERNNWRSKLTFDGLYESHEKWHAKSHGFLSWFII